MEGLIVDEDQDTSNKWIQWSFYHPLYITELDINGRNAAERVSKINIVFLDENDDVIDNLTADLIIDGAVGAENLNPIPLDQPVRAASIRIYILDTFHMEPNPDNPNNDKAFNTGFRRVRIYGYDMPTDDATLQSLEVSVGELEPEFSPYVASYTVDVPNQTENITITATTNHPEATVTGNGLRTLTPGDNEITVTVTAPDGVTKQDYQLTVTRSTAVSDDATLRSITISDGDLSLGFASNVFAYTVNLPQ